MGMHGHLRDQSEPANPEIKPQKVDQIDELNDLSATERETPCQDYR